MTDIAQTLSKNQIRKLGSRLRNADVPSKEDVSLYIAWSEGFEPALSEVEDKVRGIAASAWDTADFRMSTRIKQISSVRAKLIRQRTSLSDLEDIAGCRVVLRALSDVDRFILLCARLPVTRTRDYRAGSRNGYRAVHLTVSGEDGHAVELQIRTQIQHAWAQLTERAAASVDMDIKYGGGPADIRDLLLLFSKVVRLTDLRDYEIRAGAAFRDLIAGRVSDVQLEEFRGYLDKQATGAQEQEASFLELWATMFTETGVET